MDETPRVRRRWLWYGLPVLLGVAALIAIAGTWFAVKVRQAEKQRAAVEAIRRLGGTVRYDYQRDLERAWSAPPPGPAWLRERYGVDMVATVESVRFSPRKPAADDRLDDAGLQQLDEYLKALPHLSSMGVSGRKVTDAGLKHLAGLRQLKTLFINGTSVTDSGLEHIQGLTQLEWLYIDETGITDAGLRYLAGLERVKRLDLTKTKITGSGLRHLEGLESLTTLYLDQTGITDAGLQSLGVLHGMPALEHLALRGTAVRGPGLRCLHDLPRLRELLLTATDMDDEGLYYLADLHELKELDLAETHVTEDGAGRLRQALPKCKITVTGIPGAPYPRAAP